MSKHSPGVVENGELLSRFVFSSVHVGKGGRLKPSLFSHAEHKGCSVQRESIATADEIKTFIGDFLRKYPKVEWQSLVIGNCEQLRAIRLESFAQQAAVCVYDTAEKNNPAHAEIGLSMAFQEADLNEMRRHLVSIFDCANPVSRTSYRGGEIWKHLSKQ